MKSIFLFICLMFVAALTTHAQTQEEIDEALKYYPLKVGNYWEYKVVNDTPPLPPETFYYSIEVLSDTILTNGMEYKKLRYITEKPFYIHHFEFDVQFNADGFRFAYTLERVDSETADVFRLNPISENVHNEVLIDSLLTKIDESSTAIRWDFGHSDEGTKRLEDGSISISQNTISVRSYEITSFIGIGYSLGENIGIVSIGSSEGGGGTIEKLIYFRDHLGTEYGEAVHVSTPIPIEIPQRAALLSNYPNPFNPSTTIPYELNQSTEVRLEVYDMLGRRVALLVNETRQAGRHNAVFDSGNLSSGVYIARLVTGEQVFSRKMVLVK